ncbi:MAG: transcription-repair coupling factor [Deltaproteobacteria bacterium]|nr:MAG: transcription-repair coupling factor [Deltaproteobacteria bacterium]
MSHASVTATDRVASLGDVVARVMERSGSVRLTGLRGAARAVVGAELVRAHGDRPVVFVTPTSKRSDALLEDLRIALGADAAERVRAYPRHDTPPYDRFSPQPFVTAQRMDVLYRWLSSAGGGAARPAEPAPVVVLPWTALAARVPSRAVVRARTIHVEVGQTLDRDRLVEMLISTGYARMPLVEDRGELSVRGGILDVFPPQREKPIRIELLGDEVESIREFDPASQRSQGTLGYAVAAPPRELLFDRALVVERAPAIHALADAQQADHKVVDELVDGLLRGHLPPGAEALAPFLQPELETVFDFLADDALLVLDDPAAGRDRLVAYTRDAFDGFEAALEGGRVAVPVGELLLSPEAIDAALDARRPVSLERLDVEDAAEGAERYAIRAFAHDELRRALLKARTREAALQPLVDRLQHWCDERNRVVLVTHSPSSAERLRTLLDEYGVATRGADDARPVWRWSRPGRIEVRVARLSEGFELPIERLAVVTEDEIFGPRERRRRRTGLREAAVLEGLSQLALGDHVVHATHGIGIYRGLVTLDLGAAVGDFLRLEYQGGDRLFLPIHRLNLIQRYIGSDGHVPRIDKLGGETWERAKRSVQRSLRDMATELLAVHAAREVAEGHGFPPRDRMFEEFEASFGFDETPDQLAAIEDVLADLQKPKPMDRLVCGDVGYGKTEVAVRAAFKAVMDGKQVAVLVPTTVLAQQHEETFRQRFEGYPVRIESFSRFRSPKDSRAVVEGLLTGDVDIVIGTHRLLQKSLRFRDLGLLVVDEEHRFGVAHKERIKQLRKTVDVLTLTATPIPRTLQLAFSGVRDLSVISTPPVDRIAIRTQVARFSESLCREAVLREVRRGGQVFFVHNRVQTIDSMAELLGRIVPEVKVIVAHGQLPERELEKRMLAFLHGESDVLLCTTIIESGLDIPRANTILINRADTMGLAQLYQLRGRVGRSHHRAYAYLLLPDALTADAERRLEAIQDLSELGSGFRLANMDLEIRGAGNLLGAEQSGHLAAVGYDTYMQMLEETIEELRGNAHEAEIDPEIRLPVSARLSEDYVPEVSQRLVLYKRLASARDETEVERIHDELLDRYGPLPPEAANLLEVIRVKILARRLGVVAVDVARGEFVLSASETSRIDPQRLVNLLTRAGSGARVSPDHKIFAPLPGEPAELFPAARRLLSALGAD